MAGLDAVDTTEIEKCQTKRKEVQTIRWERLILTHPT